MGGINITQTGIEGLCILEPETVEGEVSEIYNSNMMDDVGFVFDLVQEIQLKCPCSTIRGLHFPANRNLTRLVRVTDGEVFSVAVDLRENSKTYGLWYCSFLSSDNQKQFLIPGGFAHGFEVLSESATVCFKNNGIYNFEEEYGIRWNDPNLNIPWPERGVPILNEKDSILPFFAELVH